MITNQSSKDCIRIERRNNNPEICHGGLDGFKSNQFDLMVVVKSFDWIPADTEVGAR